MALGLIVSIGDELCLLIGSTFLHDTHDGLKGFERLAVHLGTDHQAVNRARQKAVAVADGDQRHCLPLVHAVTVVYKHVAYDTVIGQGDVDSAFRREYHP